MAIFDSLSESISDRFGRDDKENNPQPATGDHQQPSALSRVGSTISGAAGAVKNKVGDVFSTGDTPGLWEGTEQARRQELDDNVQGAIHDALGSGNDELAGNAGLIGGVLIRSLDKAAGIQSSMITGYVDWVRAKHPDDTPEQLQQRLADHFKLLASSTGGAAGLAAAVPGIGLATGTAAIGAESLVFLDAATLFTLASAYLRGADISDPERRRALILLTLLGSQGTAVVDAMVGDITRTAKSSSTSAITAITKLAPAKLNELNTRLTRTAGKTIVKKVLPASLGKLVPFGIGAVIGWTASRSLAGKVITHARNSLGPLPQHFSTPAPDTVPETPKVVADLEAEANTTAVTDEEQ